MHRRVPVVRSVLRRHPVVGRLSIVGGLGIVHRLGVLHGLGVMDRLLVNYGGSSNWLLNDRGRSSGRGTN